MSAIFPPEAMLAQLASDGVDLAALRARYERMFPRRLGPVTPNDELWFARFVVDRRKYLRALDALERRETGGVGLDGVAFMGAGREAAE